jgi:hypothetical protein
MRSHEVTSLRNPFETKLDLMMIPVQLVVGRYGAVQCWLLIDVDRVSNRSILAVWSRSGASVLREVSHRRTSAGAKAK